MENFTNLQDLGGYDMVISVTQRTINSQLGALWRRNLIFPRKEIKETHEKSQLDVKVKAPTLSLEGNSTEDQKIFMTIPFTGGEFVHVGEGPYEMTDCKVTFLCEVRMREVGQDYIQGHKNLEEVVKNKMAGFTPDIFRISKLFLALKGRNQLHEHIDRERSTLPAFSTEASKGFSDVLEKYLVGHIDHDHNPMLLGFVPTHKDIGTETLSEEEKRFLVTGIRFSVTQNPEDGDHSLLNYMFMTQHREFPSGAGAGVILCDPEIKEPIYRVSHAAFAQGMVIERLRETMKTPTLNFVIHPDPWKAMGIGRKKRNENYSESQKRAENTYDDQNQVTVTFGNASPPEIGDCAKLLVQDVIRRKASYEFKNHHPGRHYSPLYARMEGSFLLHLSAGKGKLVVHKGVSGRMVLHGNRTSEYINWAQNKATPFDKNHCEKVTNHFSSWDDGPPAFDDLQFKLAEDMVIPPTGNIFTMSKVRFSLAVPGQSLINLCKTLAYRRPS